MVTASGLVANVVCFLGRGGGGGLALSKLIILLCVHTMRMYVQTSA